MSGDPKRTIAARAALELQAGEVVNLGIGIPNMIPMFLDDDAGVYLHTENGLLGVGPRPDENELDSDMIDAAKRPVTALPGASYFDSAESFRVRRHSLGFDQLRRHLFQCSIFKVHVHPSDKSAIAAGSNDERILFMNGLPKLGMRVSADNQPDLWKRPGNAQFFCGRQMTENDDEVARLSQ